MLYKIENRLSAARDEAVVDSELIVPCTEAPALQREERDKAFLPPYFAKHLTCERCCATLIHIRGTWYCNNCQWQEGCCDESTSNL